MRKALLYVLFFFAALMVVSSYSNTFMSPPFLDDFHSFISPKALYLHSISLSSLFSLSKTQFGWGRFLPVVTFALNHYLGDNKLYYFHAVNILIHLLAFFAVFWLMREILAAERKHGSRGEIPYELAGFFPLCVAAVWALSPVQTSAVTYLVQRMASMQALFFTLSAACFIRARLFSGDKVRSSVVFYFLCALAALCAFVSKENSAVLPIALAVIDIWFFDSAWLKKAWALCRKTGWKVRAAAAVALLSSFYFAFFVVLPRLLSGYSIRDFTLGERLLTEGRVVVWYMSLLLWPVPSRLAMEHDPLISTSLFSPLTTIPALILIAALIVLAVRFRKRFPVITFGIIWFFLNLVIESTVIPLELVFEHRLYLPSVGFYLSAAALFVVLLRQGSKRLPEVEFAKAVCSLLLICAAGFGFMTFIRNGVWKNTVTIHYDTVTKAPESPRANADYANTLCEVGQYKEAMKYAQKAMKLGRKGREADSLAQNAITIALIKEGKTDEAIKRDEEFLKEKGNRKIDAGTLPTLCVNVALACLDEKKPKDAYKWTLKALRYVQLTDDGSLYKKELVERALLKIFSRFDFHDVDPSLKDAAGSGKPSPAELTAMVFNKQGEVTYARHMIVLEYAKAPHDPLLKTKIEEFQKEDAQNLAQKRKWNFFQKYVWDPFSRFNFDMAVAYIVQKENLSRFFLNIGERRLDEALEISPESRDAWLLKGWYLYNRGDAVHAVEAARRVLREDPKNSNAWLALGFFLAKAGDARGAEGAFQNVIKLYPGYSKRALVERLCSQLRRGKQIQSASNKG